MIWGNGGHETKFNEDTIRHPERGICKMFPTVAETLGEVCSCGGELCWRQLGLKPRKLYLLHVLWSVRILFEQTTYSGRLQHKPKLLWFSANSVFLISCFESVRVLFMSQHIFDLYCGCQHVHFGTPWRTVAVTFKIFRFKCYSDVTLSTFVLYVTSKKKNIMGWGQVNGRPKNQPSFTHPYICKVANHL